MNRNKLMEYVFADNLTELKLIEADIAIDKSWLFGDGKKYITFNDLKFTPYSIMDNNEFFKKSEISNINYKNGYGNSILLGKNFYSNGKNLYEMQIIKNNETCYTTPLTDNVLGYEDKLSISRYMIATQRIK